MSEEVLSLECGVCYERFEESGDLLPRANPCCGAVACHGCLKEALDDGEVCCQACFTSLPCDGELAALPPASAVLAALRGGTADAADVEEERPFQALAEEEDGLPPSQRRSGGLSAFLANVDIDDGAPPPSLLSAFLAEDPGERRSAACEEEEEEEEERDSLARKAVRFANIEARAEMYTSRRISVGGSTSSDDLATRISSVRLEQSPALDYHLDLLERARLLFEAGERLPFEEVLGILRQARECLAKKPNVIRVKAPVLVVGDLHGQFADLLNVVHGSGGANIQRGRHAVGLSPGLDDDEETEGSSSSGGGFVFLGDYVDRGARGCEVFLYVVILMLRFPEKVHLLRGNHECRNLTGHFGFRAECRRKYGLHVYHECCRVFEALPLGCVVEREVGDVLCCHGGIGPGMVTLADLEAVDRAVEPPPEGVLCDVLWADPARGSADCTTFEDNPMRGCSVVFGKKALLAFLKRNNLAAVVRAHEVQEMGSAADFGEEAEEGLAPVTTVFSAPNYCGRFENLAALLRLGTTDSEVIEFSAQRCEMDFEIVADEQEAETVRWAYAECPYMPLSFEDLVKACSLLLQSRRRLGKLYYTHPLPSPKAPPPPSATKKKQSPRRPSVVKQQSCPLISTPPPASWVETTTDLNHVEDMKRHANLRRWASDRPMWFESGTTPEDVVRGRYHDLRRSSSEKRPAPFVEKVKAPSFLKDYSSEAFVAARDRDRYNEMNPLSLSPTMLRNARYLAARARNPAVAFAAANAKLTFMDSAKKSTIWHGQLSVGSVHNDELVDLRRELRDSRRSVPKVEEESLPSPPRNGPRGLLEAFSKSFPSTQQELSESSAEVIVRFEDEHEAHDSMVILVQPAADGWASFELPPKKSPLVRSRSAPDIRATAAKPFSDEEIHALRLIFSLFDMAAEESISKDDLRTYAEEVENHTVLQGDVDMCFTALDDDGDDRIGLRDWTAFAARLKAASEITDYVPTKPILKKALSTTREPSGSSDNPFFRRRAMSTNDKDDDDTHR